MDSAENFDFEDKWLPIEQFDFNNLENKLIHVDTRDFHVIGNKDLGKTSKILNLFGSSEPLDINQIKEILLKFRENSGGSEKKWRHFNLEGVSGAWLKYIRFIRVDNTNNFYAYTNSGEQHYPIFSRLLLEGNGFCYLMKDDEEDSLNEIKSTNELSFSPIKSDGKTITEISGFATTSYIIYSNKTHEKTIYSDIIPFLRDSPKIQNNEKCPCGSGLKYKKCCKK